MDGGTRRMVRPGLKLLVAEASQALARLDAVRLEELTRSCTALNRELPSPVLENRKALEREAREAVGEMAVLAQVLEATRENLRVMHRLRELRMGRLEYSQPGSAAGWRAGPSEGRSPDGDN